MRSLLAIALRNVRRHRRRSLITLSAVFLALAVVVSIRGFVNGMVASIRDGTVLGQTGAIQVHRHGWADSMAGASLDLDVPADEGFLARVAAVPGVTDVAPRIAFGALANTGDVTTPALFVGVDPAREGRVCPRRAEALSAGRGLTASDTEAGLLTPVLAGRLGLRPGARVTLLATDRDGALNALEVEVVGLFGQAGVASADKKVGIVSLAVAQRLLRMPGRATELALSVASLDSVDAAAARVAAALGSDYEVTTWHEAAPWVREAAAAYELMLGVLTVIFVFVALLGVVNTMLMAVLERTREIGTMMAIGARRRRILALFLTEAAMLGLAGSVAGAAVGSGFVYALGRHGVALQIGGMALPIHVYPAVGAGYVLSILTLATAGAVVAALWPALRASHLRPVEALAAV